MATVLRDTPITITLDDVTPMLDQLAARFQRKYGGDPHQIDSDLKLAFLTAYNDHDHHRGSFYDHLYFIGYKRLLESVRQPARRAKKLPRVALEIDELHAKPDFNMVDFLDELTPDAQRVVHLALLTPPPICEEIEERDPELKPQSIRSSVRAHLLFIGWSRDRIRETFDEIKSVLSCW